MKAIIWTAYGSPEVLRIEELERPVPGNGDILIKVHATTVTAGDCELRRLNLPPPFNLPFRLWLGFRKPRGIRIPGTEFAGVIESIGEEVTKFKSGDSVFGSTGLGFGADAEYICLPETGDLALKPEGIDFGEAAALPFGGRDALHFLRKCRLMPGQKILIYGAGGSIGTFAVQLAKNSGAEVSAVDSADKLEMLKSIGADHVIDYRNEDFTKYGRIYDVLFDVVGKCRLLRSKRSLKKDGYFLLANSWPIQIFVGLFISMTGGRKVFSAASAGTKEDLVYLRNLVEAGKIHSVMDRGFTLDQMVEAHQFVELGGKKGNVAISVCDSD